MASKEFTHKCVVVDLDGTINDGKGTAEHGYRDAATREDVIDVLHGWDEAGYQLLLDTARGQTRFGKNGFVSLANNWLEEVRSEVLDWLNENMLRYLFAKLQIGRKLFGQAYVDDKALPVDLLRQAYANNKALARKLTPEQYLSFFKSAEFKSAVCAWMEKQNAGKNV